MKTHNGFAVARALTWCGLCCAVLLIAGCGERRSEQKRNEGDVLLKNGKVAEARAAYLESADINPDNPMAQVGLGRCAVQEGNINEALAMFERARTLNSSLPEGYLEPVKLLSESGDVDGALELAGAYRLVDPHDGGLLYCAVLLKADRAAEAVPLLEEMDKQGDSPEVKLNLGIAYSKAGRMDDATKTLDAVAEGGSPLAPAASIALIEVYDAQGKIAELLQAFESLSQKLPDNVNIKLGHARVLLMSGHPDQAETIARDILVTDPESGWANYVVGAVKASQGAKDEAIAFLEKAAAALPEEKIVAARLQEIKTGAAPQAESSSQQAAAPTGPQTWRDLWKQAALKRLVDNRDQYLAEGGEEAREVLVLAALFTQNVGLAVELSRGLPETSHIALFIKGMESGQEASVAQVFENWKTEDPEEMLLRDNALGYAMASARARSRALSTFLFCLERWPDNLVALYNIAQVFRSIRQPVIASQQLQRIIVQYPDNIDAHQMLYAALREGQLYDQALKAAEASFSLFPEERWSFRSLSEAYLNTRQPRLALEVLNRAAGMFENDPEILLALAGIHLRLGDYARGQEILTNLSATAPVMTAGRANLLALCAMLEGDWNAVKIAADAADPALWPQSLRILRCIAATKEGDTEAARTLMSSEATGDIRVEKLHRILTAALGVAVEGLSEEEQQWAEALGRSPELFAAYGSTIALQMSRLFDASWNLYEQTLAKETPHVALAQLGFAALQFADSIEDVRGKAEALAGTLASDARASLALAEIYRSLGDTDAEGAALKKAVEIGPENADAWSRLAAYQDKRADYEGARESYRKLVELQPESPAANNNYAYMILMTGGDANEALKFAGEAAKKQPGDPGILHTLGLAQLRAGEAETSRGSLEKASEIDPGNPTIAFDFGRALLELGERDKAKERIRYALGMSQRAGLDFPEREAAEQLLSELN